MIPLAISTRWNAGRHRTGEAMLAEILALGLDRVDLGYDLRAELIPGVKAMVASGAVRVGIMGLGELGRDAARAAAYLPTSNDRATSTCGP